MCTQHNTMKHSSSQLKTSFTPNSEAQTERERPTITKRRVERSNKRAREKKESERMTGCTTLLFCTQHLPVRLQLMQPLFGSPSGSPVSNVKKFSRWIHRSKNVHILQCYSGRGLFSRKNTEKMPGSPL